MLKNIDKIISKFKKIWKNREKIRKSTEKKTTTAMKKRNERKSGNKFKTTWKVSKSVKSVKMSKRVFGGKKNWDSEEIWMRILVLFQFSVVFRLFWSFVASENEPNVKKRCFGPCYHISAFLSFWVICGFGKWTGGFVLRK